LVIAGSSDNLLDIEVTSPLLVVVLSTALVSDDDKDPFSLLSSLL